jgi:glycosyltransferase involved in cell wall biosynthesis
MKSKSALFLDPSLHSRDGHHFYALSRLQLEVDKLGLKRNCLISRYAAEAVLKDVHAQPEFERGIYARQSWTQAEFEEHAKLFANELTAAVKRHRLKPDIVIVPSGDQVLAAGIARHLMRRRRPVPELLMWLLMPPSFSQGMAGPQAEQLLGEYRSAFSELRRAMQDDRKIHLFCETTALARSYEGATGIKVGIAASPNMIDEGLVRPPRTQGTPTTVLCLGNVNRAKGYPLLPEAVRLVHKERPDIQFVIHGTTSDTDFPEAKAIFAELAAIGGNIKTLNHHLGSEEYQALLHRADLLLLPYDPAIYSARGSGIFGEATKLGIPIVAPRACDFARQAFEDGRAVAMPEYTSKGLATAILDGTRRLDQLIECARTYALENSDKTSEIVCDVAAAAGRSKATLWERLQTFWPRMMLD